MNIIGKLQARCWRVRDIDNGSGVDARARYQNSISYSSSADEADAQWLAQDAQAIYDALHISMAYGGRANLKYDSALPANEFVLTIDIAE